MVIHPSGHSDQYEPEWIEDNRHLGIALHYPRLRIPGLQRIIQQDRVFGPNDGLSAEKIEALLRKWLRLLPHPFAAKDRQAGYRYQLSILQIELSLTQVLDRPVSGRIFFEQVIRENLDIGRPKQIQLIFERWVTKRTPDRFARG
jgi:hypothetical protein